jgi:protein-S-isoprenylcysteine O-methyltransferase Ste14
LLAECAGIVLGLWAIWTIRPLNFNIVPDVRVEGFLVEEGPYAYIRHPMYSAMLLVVLALVADSPSGLRVATFVLLGLDVLAKIVYEEKLLSAHYPRYTAYMADTKRLIPFVF